MRTISLRKTTCNYNVIHTHALFLIPILVTVIHNCTRNNEILSPNNLNLKIDFEAPL